MEGLLNFVYPALAILQLIGVICFFWMCANVNSIKKKVGTRSQAFYAKEYRKHIMFNDIDQAREAVKNLVFLVLSPLQNSTAGDREEHYNNCKRRYEYMCLKVGIEFPPLNTL